MSLSFSCNQYDQAFNSKRLVNWERSKWYRRKPAAQEGFTQFASNDRGHLLPAIPRSSKSPWGTFMGTWDLPKKIPGNKMLDPTSRTEEAYYKNVSEKCSADTVIRGKLKTRRPVAGQQAFVKAAEGISDLIPPEASGQNQPQMHTEVILEKVSSPAVAMGLRSGSARRLSPNIVSPKLAPAATPLASRPMSRQVSRPPSQRAMTPKAASPCAPSPMRSPHVPRAATGPAADVERAESALRQASAVLADAVARGSPAMQPMSPTAMA